MAEDNENCGRGEECPECRKIYRDHIYRHLITRHNYTDDMIEKLKEEKRNQRIQASYFYSCETCSKPFPSIRALRGHERSMHDDYLRPGTIICPSCGATFKDHVSLVAHAQAQHSKSDDEFVVERAFFKSKDEYETWKNLMDDTDGTTRAVSSVSQRGDKTITYLRCSVNRCKSMNCTSFMKVIERNSGVEVDYCRNHLGHLPTVENFRMDKNSVDYIVCLLKDGFAPSQIICKIRSEFGSGSPRSRLFYTTTRDIRKISEKNGIVPGRLHSNDVISVESRVARNSPEDGVRYYQAHKEENGDGLVMVIVTPTQQRWLQKYGRRGICIDDTFNLTGYNLRVAILVLANEWDMGIPGGYLLSFRMTANEVSILFAEVKKLVPDFDPAFFMSDDTNTFYNGFVHEFPETKSVKLLCAFHVAQSVLRNANSKLKEKSLASFVKREMSVLCYTRVESEFNDRYQKLLMSLKAKGEVEMLKYLNNNWSSRISQWAGFARIYSPFNTSMLVERFHKRLKHENQSRVGNARLDSIVHCLINTPVILAHDFEIRMCRRLSYGRHRFAEQLVAHKAGIKALQDAKIQVAVTNEGEEVHMGGTYYIKQRRCDCDPALNNHCNRDGCGACPYGFCCTCIADGKAGVCCLHIHAAMVAHPEGRQFHFPPEDSNNVSFAGDANNNEVHFIAGYPEVDVGNKENVEKNDTDRMDRNKENIQKIETLCSRIKALALEIGRKPEGSDILNDVVVNMQEIYADLSARTAQRAPFKRRLELNTVGPIKKDPPIRLLSRKAAKKLGL